MRPDEKKQRVYSRELPGGGFVAIDVCDIDVPFHDQQCVGTLIVERRLNWRRGGESPPVVVEATGANVESVVSQLLPTALNNPAIAVALLRFDSRSALAASPV